MVRYRSARGVVISDGGWPRMQISKCILHAKASCGLALRGQSVTLELPGAGAVCASNERLCVTSFPQCLDQPSARPRRGGAGRPGFTSKEIATRPSEAGWHGAAASRGRVSPAAPDARRRRVLRPRAAGSSLLLATVREWVATFGLGPVRATWSCGQISGRRDQVIR